MKLILLILDEKGEGIVPECKFFSPRVPFPRTQRMPGGTTLRYETSN